MQKIDPAYLYELGAKIRPVSNINGGSDPITAYFVITQAREAVFMAVSGSIYSHAMRQARLRGETFHDILVALGQKILADVSSPLEDEDVDTLQGAYGAFEAAFLIELQNSPIYLVRPKGGFDQEALIDRGEELFPADLITKVSGAVADARDAARALAFELWTAAGFHLHRINEAVLREYFDHVAGINERPTPRTMGTMYAKMEALKVGDQDVIAALRNLTKFHRNPLMHPDQSLSDQDEAISLYAASRAAIGYMLAHVPSPAGHP